MSDESPAVPSPRYVLNGQYVKDLSFEHPNAPRSLFEFTGEKPKIDMAIDLKAQRLRDNFFELTLHLEVKASANDEAMFLIDLSYSGLLTLMEIAEDMIEPVLLAEVPYTLYPFARRVVADVTRDGGFPPLLLDPIDFASLYRQSKTQGETASA